ncbi:MAG: efflux RND transporter periplasmic adaptor subunit [bacterium]
MAGKRIIAFIVVCLWLAFFYACKKPETETTDAVKNSDDVKKIKVEAYKVFTGSVYGEINTSGRIEGIEEALVSAEAAGKVESIFVNYGDFIKKGMSIIKLDDKVAKALYLQSRIQYDIARNAMETAQKLFDQGNASEMELKNAVSQERAAKANLEGNKIMYEGYSLLSPISGYVISKRVRVGEQIAPGIPVVKLSNISRLKVVCFVGDGAIPKINKQCRVKIKISALPQEDFNGKIRHIGAGIDDMNGGYAVEIVFNNTKKMAAKSGMTADITIITDKKADVPMIPQICVIISGEKKYVFKNHLDKVSRMQIRVGRVMNGNYEVLSGIKTGDIIAGSRLADLKDATPVEVFLRDN